MTLSSHNHAKEVVPVYWGGKVVAGEVSNIEEDVLFVKLPFIAGYLLTTLEQVSTLEDIIRERENASIINHLSSHYYDTRSSLSYCS